MSRQQQDSSTALTVQPPRLPFPANDVRDLKVTEGQWKALVDAIYPSAKTVDGVVLALRYCQSRGLDPFKRAVHVVPMWNSALGREVETVWPGINELRTTASRTTSWAGNDECLFGPTLKRGFKDSAQRGREGNKYIERGECAAFDFPEWAQITVYRIIAGQRVPFVGPKVRFIEMFSGEKGLRVPNAKWRSSPFQMLEKCAEAAALRRAFPEELANDYTAEEMEGKVTFGGTTVEATAVEVKDDNPADQRPTRESVLTEWETKSIPKERWDDIEGLQPQIDAATDAKLLRDRKEHFIDKAIAGSWPTEALDELELRFDTAIARIEGTDTVEDQEEENEQETD